MKKILVFAAIVIAVISTSCNHQENTIKQYLKDNSNSGWAEVVDMKVDTIQFNNKYIIDSLKFVATDLALRAKCCSEIADEYMEESDIPNYKKYQKASDNFKAKSDSIAEVLSHTKAETVKICSVKVKYREFNELGNKVINDCVIYTDIDFKHITKNPIELTQTL